MRIMTVLGARPQFIKAGPLTQALRPRHKEILVHTGQHYDHGMSEIFFQELDIPAPDHHLGLGGGGHGVQTGAMLASLEGLMLAERPDVVLVYGDTNSTLAGGLTAAKLHIPVAHVEAGLRSFNRGMPEEINRVLTDHLSSLLFAPSEAARTLLATEGITRGVHVVGDIMHDAVRIYGDRAREVSPYPGKLGLSQGGYCVCTVHRAENADHRDRLASILQGLEAVPLPVVFPVHPRTKKRQAEFGLATGDNVRCIEPVGYLDMLALLRGAACLLTDSGGLQKEAYYCATPCVTLRQETEWTETVEAGWNVLAGVAPETIADQVRTMIGLSADRPALYGRGDTAGRIVDILERRFGEA